MKKLSIELADTPSKRSTGLMHRKHLAENNGMLFKFPHEDNLRFWMKDTYVPLDIAFLDDNGKILQIEEMYPLSYRQTISSRPCKMALEVNHGWFSKNDLGVGDVISGIDVASNKYRIAQMTPPPNLEEDLQNDTGAGEMGPQEVEEPNPKVEMVLDDKAKVQYAERNNLAMQIVYLSKKSQQTLPPRKIVPIPGEGYPTGVSDGGDYFTAYDASPTINGGEWEIIGNQIKRFLFSNIIALEVIEEFVNK